MTKADIVRRVVARTGFSKEESFDLVEEVLEQVKCSLESGEKVKITRFGSFVPITRKDRPGRNPHTGENVTVRARRVVHFWPSEVLKVSVNKPRWG